MGLAPSTERAAAWHARQISHVPRTEVSVLVVDNQDTFRRVARAVVERADGFVLAAEATNAADALAAAAALPPRGLVLMDIGLSGHIDGIRATRGLVDRHPGLVVLLLSSYEPTDLPVAARTCGAAAYVVKHRLSPTLLRTVWDRWGQPG